MIIFYSLSQWLSLHDDHEPPLAVCGVGGVDVRQVAAAHLRIYRDLADKS